MKIIIFACSLNPKSKSFELAKFSFNYLKEQTDKNDVELIDLRETPLPFCDGASCYKDERVWAIQAKIKEADVILFAVPIYNYEVNSAAKNLIDISGYSFKNKTIGFMASAGGESSYMSLLPMINSMMLQNRSIVVPRFVYASGENFDENGLLINEEVKDRLKDLSNQSIELAKVTAPIMNKYE